MSSLYIYIDYKYNFAVGPLSILALYCKEVLPDYNLDIFTSLDKVKKFVDETDDAFEIEVKHFFISSQSLNGQGYEKAVKSLLELIIPSMLVTVGSKNVDTIYVNQNPRVTSSYYLTEFNVSHPNMKFARLVSWVKRTDRIRNQYSKLYPVYNWASNNGVLTEDHIEAILKHGLSVMHLRYTLIGLPAKWLRSHSTFNTSLMFLPDPFKFVPTWWDEVSTEMPLETLTKSELRFYWTVVKAAYPSRFKSKMRSLYESPVSTKISRAIRETTRRLRLANEGSKNRRSRLFRSQRNN